MIDEITKKEIEEMMKKLNMVEWDRFVNPAEGEYWLYGWISREKDGYKDFVVLSRISQWWWYITSSEEYSERISEIVHGKEATHSPCMRVENHFDVPNSIKI